MKTKLLLTVFFFGLLGTCLGQEMKPGEQQTQSLGKYWFVMYRKGSNWDQDSATKVKTSLEHINCILALRKIGEIITGGAFLDKATWTGFEICNCETKDDVLKITEADPMVLAKIFSYEIHPWTTLKGMVKFD
jgi:uncharacterized protein YciI